MMPSLPPPIPPAIIQCATIAAQEYQVPRILLLAIMKTESGWRQNLINVNRNGTYDIGIMQINSRWAKRLKTQYGIPDAEYRLRTDYCYNIRVGAWILKQELGNVTPTTGYHEYWRRVGNYHSRNPRHNKRYRQVVMNNLRWLIKNGWY